MDSAASGLAKTDSGAGRSRARFVVLALISVGTMINYLDRAVLGVAAPSLTRELGLDAVVMGVVFSAFSWTYAAAQIPGARRAVHRSSTSRHGASSSSSRSSARQSELRSGRPSAARQPSRAIRWERGGQGRNPSR